MNGVVMKRALLGTIALGAILSANSASAALFQYGGLFNGLAFNEVDALTPPGEIPPDGNQYSFIQTATHLQGANEDITRIYNMSALPPTFAGAAALLGQFNYTMWYDAPAELALSMNQINWHGGEIRFEESTVPITFESTSGPETASLVITGGVFHIALLSGSQAGNTENLPYDFGANQLINYEITANSFLTFELALPDGVVTGTFSPNNLNVTQNDPFNGIMIDPANDAGEDIAFFMHNWIASTNSAFTCTSGSCSEILTQLGLNIAGWGVGAAAVPEPAMLGLFGLGLLGFGIARRRRLI